MPFICPSKGCQAEPGLCVHDKTLMAIAVILALYSLATVVLQVV